MLAVDTDDTGEIDLAEFVTLLVSASKQRLEGDAEGGKPGSPQK
jgi:hypothetical protein